MNRGRQPNLLVRLPPLLWWLLVWSIPLLWEWHALPDQRARNVCFGVRMRGFAEAMGAAYAKLGQFLSARYDLLPREVCDQLGGLLDASPPADFPDIAFQIEDALGAPLDVLFASIEREPIATGSIAQVHGAVSHTGQRLAVKVLRPHIVASMRADTALMRQLAQLLAAVLPGDSGRIFVEIVGEFAEQLHQELDLDRERASLSDSRFKLGPNCSAPAPIPALCAASVLTMERAEGLPFTALTGIDARSAGERLSAAAPGATIDGVALCFAYSCLTQFFLSGRFHGDPHPGNVLVAPSGDLIFLDFGLSGTLDPADSLAMACYFLALVQGQLHECMPHLAHTLIFDNSALRPAFFRGARAILLDWSRAAGDPSVPLEDRVSARYHQRMMTLMWRHDVRMKPRFVLFWRAQIMLDAVMLAWPTTIDLPAAMRDFLIAERPDVLLAQVAALTRRPAIPRGIDCRTGEISEVIVNRPARRSARRRDAATLTGLGLVVIGTAISILFHG